MGTRAPVDKAALQRILDEQNGVIARNQAIKVGLTNHALRHRLRDAGPWARLLPSVYMATTGTPALPQLFMAAQLYGGSGSVITGPAVLGWHGIWHPEREIIDVLIPATRRRLDTEFVRIHRTTRMPERIWKAGALTLALPERAVADTAMLLRALGDVRAVVASGVQRGKCTITGLVHELDEGPRQGSANFRTALSDVVAGIRSTAEADLKDVLGKSSLPTPLFNPLIFSGDDFIAMPDGWYPEYGIAIEVDSKEWHLSPDAHRKTVARARRMAQLSIVVLTFTPNDIRKQPGQVIAEIRRAIQSARSAGRLSLNLRTIPVDHPDHAQLLASPHNLARLNGSFRRL